MSEWMGVFTELAGQFGQLLWVLFAILMVFLFREPLGEAIRRGIKFKGAGAELEVGGPSDNLGQGAALPALPAPKTASRETQPVSGQEARLGQEAGREAGPTPVPAATVPDAADARPYPSQAAWSLFWVGHDLMWTEHALAENAQRSIVMRGIQSAIAHLQVIHPDEPGFLRKLQDCKDWAQHLSEDRPGAAADVAVRRALVAELQAFKTVLGQYFKDGNSPYA